MKIRRRNNRRRSSTRIFERIRENEGESYTWWRWWWWWGKLRKTLISIRLGPVENYEKIFVFLLFFYLFYSAADMLD